MKKTPASDLVEKGLAFHRQGDLAKARSCYETAIQSNSRNSDALHLLGLVTASMGDIDRGISWVEKALRVQPVFPAAWYNLGNFLQKKTGCPMPLKPIGRPSPNSQNQRTSG